MNSIETILQKTARQERLSESDALTLYHDADLLQLAHSANAIRQRLHPEPMVTYVVDRNINYTNICVSECRFCAFYRSKDHSEAYVISKVSLKQKIAETLELGGTQILLQGGIHPEMTLEDHADLLRFIKSNFKIHIHGFSPPEIHHMALKADQPLKETLLTLMDAGLDSIPGGGAEILMDRVRQKVSPNKCNADQWLEVMRVAHQLGLHSTATMMFGHIETPEEMIGHLAKIRSLQDETGGFTAFIPWTFQPKNTQIAVSPTSSAIYLKVLALCRLFLDNISNIQASWVTQGAKIGQVALAFGANDLGSTMIEENVVAAAGVHFLMPKEEIIRLIETAGYTACQRDCFYNLNS